MEAQRGEVVPHLLRHQTEQPRLAEPRHAPRLLQGIPVSTGTVNHVSQDVIKDEPRACSAESSDLIHGAQDRLSREIACYTQPDDQRPPLRSKSPLY